MADRTSIYPVFQEPNLLFRNDVPGELVGLGARAAYPRLYRNRGDGTFEDRTAEAGLIRPLYAMGSNFDDLDGDGWHDLYLGTGEPDLRALMPNRVLVQREDGFREVTIPGGFGHLGKGHGVAVGDLDHDGDQDLYVVIGGAVEGDVGRNLLLVNPGHGNNWISLDLEGETANRSGIGARVSVTLETPRGRGTVRRTVGSGGSFGASSLRQEIGLGDATGVVELRIRWPGSGTVDVWEHIEPGYFYEVREGIRPERFSPPTVTFSAPGDTRSR